MISITAKIMMRRLLIAALPTALLCAAANAARSPRPDIVLFIADDLARDDLGAYGSRDARTPAIDRLARDGLRFTAAFAASPTCTPSRSAMFTGLYPMRNGAHANHSAIRPGVRTLPSYLAAAGYRVVIAGKTDFGERASFPFEYMPTSVIAPPAGEGVLASNLDVAAVDRLLEQRDPARPLALIVASFASHVPWPENKGYRPAGLTLPPTQIDTPETREARARYLTKVTQADDELAAVRAAVARHGRGRDTLFLFTADQGPQFPFAKWTLYDAGIAAPLIAVWPGHVAAGRTTDAMVSLVDLLPTMVAAGGGRPAPDLDGRSFLPVMLGRQARFREKVFAAHSGVLQTGPKANIAPMRAIRTDRYKLIVNFRTDIRTVNAISANGERDGSYWRTWVERAAVDPGAAAVVARFHHRPPVELYDLRVDPSEQRNLAADPAYRPILATLRTDLNKWMATQGERPDAVALPSAATPGHFPYAQ